MIAEKLRAAVLQAAISGKLTEQRPEDGTAADLLTRIAEEKAALVKVGKIKKPKPLPPITEDEQPFEIPESWQWVRLGEIGRYIQRGRGPKYADFSDYIAISQKCVQWAGFMPHAGRPYASDAFRRLSEERLLRSGDLLWNSTGTGTVGRAVVVSESPALSKMAADSHVTVIRTFPGVETRYLWSFIASPEIQDNLDELTSGTTKQRELNLTTVLGLPVSLPPVAEQERIVAKLDELMPLIDQLAELERERERI